MEYLTGLEICNLLKIHRCTLCQRAKKLGISQDGKRMKYTTEEVNRIQFFKYRNKKQAKHEFVPVTIKDSFYVVESKLNTM